MDKVASTSWLSLLKDACGDRTFGRNSSKLKKLLESNELSVKFFKFTFVRHPLDRIRSAYKLAVFVRQASAVSVSNKKVKKTVRKRLLVALILDAANFGEFADSQGVEMKQFCQLETTPHHSY